MTPEWSIDTKTLKGNLGDFQIIDVRESSELDTGIIEGSLHIPLAELEDRAPNEVKKDQPIVVYCAAGIRSMEAILLLKPLGFESVKSLEGGIAAWNEDS